MTTHSSTLGSPESKCHKDPSRSIVKLADTTGHELTALADDLLAHISDPDFPCTFVKAAIKKRTLWIAHADLAEPDCAAIVHRMIGDYLRVVEACDSPKEAAIVVLLLDIEVPPSADAESIRELAWTLLQQVHEYDAKMGHAWPVSVPTDIHATNWAYCLHGVRLFVNMTSSELNARHSRDLGRKLVLVIQPTDGLHYIAPQNSVGDRIRERIRSRIDAYDEIPHSLALNNAGADGNSDASQYWLGDTNDDDPWTPPTIPTCPRHGVDRHRRRKPR